MPDIRLLTFDLDNTLWDVEAIIVRAERSMMLFLAQHYPALTAQFDGRALQQLRNEVALLRPEIAHDLTRLRTATLHEALRRSGHSERVSTEGAQAAFEVFFTGRNTVEFFPNALETLEQLKQDFTLYALSNGNADIRRIGLAHLFTLHLSAADVGAAKPNPAIYVRALEHAGLRPEQVIHIGDHPEQDIAAAQSLGMRTIWVNFQGQAWTELKRADGEIQTFAELPAVIARLRH